jgi:transposase
MAQNFIDCDREQAFLMPPSLRDWLPEDHLAWFVIDAVSRLDLGAFYAAYQADGHGRAAYEPSMMASSCTRIRRTRGPRAGSSAAAVRTSRIG